MVTCPAGARSCRSVLLLCTRAEAECGLCPEGVRGWPPAPLPSLATAVRMVEGVHRHAAHGEDGSRRATANFPPPCRRPSFSWSTLLHLADGRAIRRTERVRGRTTVSHRKRPARPTEPRNRAGRRRSSRLPPTRSTRTTSARIVAARRACRGRRRHDHQALACQAPRHGRQHLQVHLYSPRARSSRMNQVPANVRRRRAVKMPRTVVPAPIVTPAAAAPASGAAAPAATPRLARRRTPKKPKEEAE